MRNYLLFLALVWMPFTYGCGFSKLPFGKGALKDYEDLTIAQVKKLELSGSGKVTINFIPLTEEPSVEILSYKKEKITTAKAIKNCITIRGNRTNKKIFMDVKAKEGDQWVLRINIHSLKNLNVVGDNLHVTIEGSTLLHKDANTFLLSSSGKSKVFFSDFQADELQIISKGDSDISFSKISAHTIYIDMNGNSILSGTHLQVKNSSANCFYARHHAKINIKNIEADSFTFFGTKDSEAWFGGGKVKHASIYLWASSILRAPQLHIEEGGLTLRHASRAHLAIKKLLKKRIDENAQFKNEIE